jgi:hypothetical protein
MFLKDFAQAAGVDIAQLEELNEEGYLTINDWGNGTKYVPWGDEKLAAIISFPHLKDKILILSDSYMYGYHPELADYLCFHEVIDIVCWLLKLCYSSKDTVKKRNYRLHTLLRDFLNKAEFDLGKVNRLVGSAHSKDKFSFHLNKGWYNELVRSCPLDADALNIGTKHDPNHSKGKSVAWNITQSYYAVYEYVNALVFTNVENLRTEEHRKSTRHFNTTLLGKFAKHLVKYPFNITSPLLADMSTLRDGEQKFWHFQYARYPRDASKSIYELEKTYIKLTASEGNFLDFMYNFRVWANYLGINSIIGLEEGYYLTYLYKNLGVLCFFYACFAEIMALAFLGEDATIELLENIASKYILKQDDFRENWYYVPMFIRFRLYREFGLVKNDIDFLTPLNLDPILYQAHRF